MTTRYYGINSKPYAVEGWNWLVFKGLLSKYQVLKLFFHTLTEQQMLWHRPLHLHCYMSKLMILQVIISLVVSCFSRLGVQLAIPETWHKIWPLRGCVPWLWLIRWGQGLCTQIREGALEQLQEVNGLQRIRVKFILHSSPRQTYCLGCNLVPNYYWTNLAPH